jgi:hypothetical protein
MGFPHLLRLFLALASLALAGASLAQARLTFDIPAQAASEAIRTLARQSGLQVAALTDDLSGIRTNAVRGVYQPMEALKLLIKDTGLQIDLTEANAVTIHRDGSTPASHRNEQPAGQPPA